MTSLSTVSWLSRTQSTVRSTSRSTSAGGAVVEDPLGEAAHRRPPRRGEQVLADHGLDHGLDVVVVEDLERAADDGGTLLGDPVRAAGAGQPGAGLARDVTRRQLLLDHLFGEEIGLHEFAQRGADLVLAARDDRGVRDLDAHGVLEQGRDGEPVREGAHHAALGRGADVFEPGYCFCRANATTKITAMTTSSERARSFIRRSAAAFSASLEAAERCPGGPGCGRARPASRGAFRTGSWLSVDLHEPSLVPPRACRSANVSP